MDGWEITLLTSGVWMSRIFNTGSPWNIPAGQGGANLDKLIAHYERKNFEEEEKKVRTLRDGKKEPDPDSIVRRGTY